MAEITAAEIRAYLSMIQGQEITLADLRREFHILAGTKSFNAVRNIMFQLTAAKVVRPTGKKNGVYKVVTRVEPVSVFGIERERRPPFELYFPRNYDTMEEMDFFRDIVIREGDLILIAGLSNYGKTTLCMNFLAENIDSRPVLMGNEYTSFVEDEYKPTPRFLNRLDNMDWVQWVDEAGQDKFTLLPVWDDYAEYIVKDKINIIDWLNIESGEHYLIGNLLQRMKRNVGRGIIIAAIQKKEDATAGVGGQFTKYWTDLEILVDRFGKSDVLLTIGKTKETTRAVSGNTYAYMISQGVKIIDFRQVKRCPSCHGFGAKKGSDCERCEGRKYINFDLLNM